MNSVAGEAEEIFLNPVFKAVIIYDDVGCAARATTLLERVADRADGAMKCDIKLWRLDVLWQPTLAAITNAVATDANLILFALGGSHPPPEELLKWLEHWSAHRRILDVAVALFGPETDAATPLWHELERFARRRGLLFFGAAEAWDDEALAAGIRMRPPWDAAALESLSLVEPAPATSHWGIND